MEEKRIRQVFEEIQTEMVGLKHEIDKNQEKIENFKSYRVVSKVLARHKQKKMKQELARKEETCDQIKYVYRL